MDSEKEKYTIKPLTNDCDYGLWKIRVTAALEALGLAGVTVTDSASETSGGASAAGSGRTTGDDDDNKRRRAFVIIIRALSDAALRVVRDVITDPVQMLAKLDARYDNKSTAAKISKMSELVSIAYKNSAKDIRKHIDKLAGLVAQLKAMKTPIADTIAVGILLASIPVPSLDPITAAIKTLADDQMTWDNVATRLIEEWRELPALSAETAFGARTRCDHCGRGGHTAKYCRARIKAKKVEKKKRESHARKRHESDESSTEEEKAMSVRAA